MAIRYVKINKKHEALLDQSQKLIQKRISDQRHVIPIKLLEELKALLDPENLGTVVDLHVTQDTQSNWASGGSCVKLHPRCFDDWQEKGSVTRDPPRLTAVLLHELVHFALGTELDAEFFENRLFTRHDGAVLPTEEDEEEFKDSHYTGVYVAMNSKTREVTDRSKPELVLGSLARATKLAPKPLPQPKTLDNAEAPMANDKQEKLAEVRIQKMAERKRQVGIRIVVEFTGYVKKSDLNKVMGGIRDAVYPNVEGNGGGGS